MRSGVSTGHVTGCDGGIGQLASVGLLNLLAKRLAQHLQRPFGTFPSGAGAARMSLRSSSRKVTKASAGTRRKRPILGVALGIAVPILTVATSRLLPPSKGGTVETVPASGPAWRVLAIVLTASVTEELLFRAYPIERLARLTGARWPGALLSLAAFVAFHLHGWHLGHVLGVVLPLGAVVTGLYLWRRNVVFVIITHFLLDLPLVLVAFGVLAQM